MCNVAYNIQVGDEVMIIGDENKAIHTVKAEIPKTVRFYYMVTLHNVTESIVYSSFQLNDLYTRYFAADKQFVLQQLALVKATKEHRELRQLNIIGRCSGRDEAWLMVFSKPCDKLSGLVFCDYLQDCGWGEVWSNRAELLREVIDRTSSTSTVSHVTDSMESVLPVKKSLKLALIGKSTVKG